MIDGIWGHELCEIMTYICKESKHVVERWWDCLKIWNPKLQCCFKMWKKSERVSKPINQYIPVHNCRHGRWRLFSSHSSNGTLRNRLSGKVHVGRRKQTQFDSRSGPKGRDLSFIRHFGSFLYETSQCRALGFKRWGETFQWGWERPHQCESLEAWWFQFARLHSTVFEWLKSPFNHAWNSHY